MRRETKAFTLLELLIVMVIIGILAIVAIPQYLDAVQSAKETSAITELKEFREIALMLVSMGEAFPGTATGTVISVDINNDGSAEKSLTLVNTITCTAADGTGTCTITPAGGNAVTIDMPSGKISGWGD